MKVLIVNGSARKEGYTAKALHVVENVLKENNIETEWFQLNATPVRGCIGCNSCKKN